MRWCAGISSPPQFLVTREETRSDGRPSGRHIRGRSSRRGPLRPMVARSSLGRPGNAERPRCDSSDRWSSDSGHPASQLVPDCAQFFRATTSVVASLEPLRRSAFQGMQWARAAIALHGSVVLGHRTNSLRGRRSAGSSTTPERIRSRRMLLPQVGETWTVRIRFWREQHIARAST